MRKDTLNNIIRGFIAIGFCVWSMNYLMRITFVTEGEYLSQYTGEILGFIMGTAISTIIGFYFNNSNLNDVRRQTDSINNGNGKDNGNADIQPGRNDNRNKQDSIQENS